MSGLTRSEGDFIALTLQGFQLLAWNFGGRSLLKVAMLSQFCSFHKTLKFSMLCLEQVTQIRDSDSYYEMWGNDIAWNLFDWCNVLWNGSLSKMATLSQCSYFLISAGRWCCRPLNVLYSVLSYISEFRFCFRCLHSSCKLKRKLSSFRTLKNENLSNKMKLPSLEFQYVISIIASMTRLIFSLHM